MEDEHLSLMQQQYNEHQAWLKLVEELRAAGVGEIEVGEKHYPIWKAIVKWGEELAELRRLDPNPEHGRRALAEKREM